MTTDRQDRIVGSVVFAPADTDGTDPFSTPDQSETGAVGHPDPLAPTVSGGPSSADRVEDLTEDPLHVQTAMDVAVVRCAGRGR